MHRRSLKSVVAIHHFYSSHHLTEGHHHLSSYHSKHTWALAQRLPLPPSYLIQSTFIPKYHSDLFNTPFLPSKPSSTQISLSLWISVRKFTRRPRKGGTPVHPRKRCHPCRGTWHHRMPNPPCVSAPGSTYHPNMEPIGPRAHAGNLLDRLSLKATPSGEQNIQRRMRVGVRDPLRVCGEVTRIKS